MSSIQKDKRIERVKLFGNIWRVVTQNVIGHVCEAKMSAAQLSMMFKDKRWQVVRIESDQSSDHQTYNSGSPSEEDECKWEAEKRWCNN
ncbi:hypothetical protein V6Z11_D11G008500 [Gossypium hirsutum]